MFIRKYAPIILALVLGLTVLLTACSLKPAAQATVQIPNPIAEVTADEMTQKTGVALTAPANAENVHWFVINGQEKIAQVTFDLNEKAYTYRAVTSQMDSTALSGVYFGTAKEDDVSISYNQGKLLTEGKNAVVYWQDRVPGICYALICTDCDSPEQITEAANAAFVPAQGNS